MAAAAVVGGVAAAGGTFAVMGAMGVVDIGCC